jgi:hypothetical protein
VPLPSGYALDASDPELLLLLRPDGARAAAFSARGATVEGILEAVGQDVRTVNPSAERGPNHAGCTTPPARNGRRL